MLEEKRALTEAEFCQAVNISRTTAWLLRKKGELAYCRIGAKILYTPQHVEQFLATHERPVISRKQKKSKEE